MNSSTFRRLAADQSSLHTAGLPPNYLFLAASTSGDSSSIPDDLTQLTVLLAGPQGTPYASGLWKLHLKIPSDYPRSPPKAAFRTRIWHPNVEENTGAVCVDTLKRDWESKLTLRDVLITISCLLINPNPDSALNAAAGQLLQDDYEAFARQAKLMASIHAAIPKDMREAVAEAKQRGEDPNMAISGEIEETQAAPRPKPRATPTSRVVMKRPPLPNFPAHTDGGFSAGSVNAVSNDNTSNSSIPIQLLNPRLVPSLPVHEDDDSSVASAYNSENEDPEISSKENNPSLSCSPVLAPTFMPHRLTVSTTSSSVLGKRALAELPIPVDPDSGSYYSDYYYYSSDEDDEYSDGEDLSPSERNIAANVQSNQQGANALSNAEQSVRRPSSASMSRTSSSSTAAMSRRPSAATSIVEEGPQRKSPRLTERGPGVNSSGRIRDDLESLFASAGHVLNGSGSTSVSGFVTPFEDLCEQEGGNARMKSTAGIANEGKENVGDSTPAASQSRFVTGVVKKLPNGTIPTATGPSASTTPSIASSLGRTFGAPSLRKPAGSGIGSWKGRPRIGLRRL